MMKINALKYQEVDFPTETDVQSHDSFLAPVNPISQMENTVLTRDEIHTRRKI